MDDEGLRQKVRSAYSVAAENLLDHMRSRRVGHSLKAWAMPRAV
jgi:hypothetical protein